MGAVAQLDRRRAVLAHETPLTLDHLEKRAQVRQGFKAARRWPLAEAPLDRRGATVPWAEAAE